MKASSLSAQNGFRKKGIKLAISMIVGSLLFASLFVQPESAQAAQAYQLTNYLETGTPVPGAGTGAQFTGFSSLAPSFDNGILCFIADFYDPTSGSNAGLFAVDPQGTVIRIVFGSDASPAGGAFGFLDDELLVDGMVSWRASGVGGIYMRASDGTGPVISIADITTNVPDSSGDLFDSFSSPGRDGNFVFFRGRNGQTGAHGLYIKNLTTNSLSVFADLSTPSPFPGVAATLTRAKNPMTRGGQFTASGTDSNGVKGLLTDFGSGIIGPINTTVASPSGLGDFTAFDESAIDGDYVVFQGQAQGADFWGIYLYNHATGTFTTIADESIPLPDGGLFDGFSGNPSLSVRDSVVTVIFETDGGTEGIWAWIDGTLLPVIRQGDNLDGKVVDNFDYRIVYGADGTTTAITGGFTDGSETLYLAELVTSVPAIGAIETFQNYLWAFQNYLRDLIR